MSEATAGAKIAGLGLEGLAASVGILNNAGQQGSEAGTALNAVLRNLTKASEELGTEVVRDAAGGLDLASTLQQIADATSDLDIDERGDLLQKLFGDEGKVGLVPLLDQIDRLREGRAALEGLSPDFVAEEYKAFLEDPSGQWQLFVGNVQSAGTALGNTLLPGLSMVVGGLAGVLGGVADAIDRFPVLGKVIGVAVGGIAIALTGLAIFNAATWAKGVFLGMKAAAAGTWLFNAALWANPVTWVVAGVVALGVGLAALVVYWDDVKAAAGAAWDWMVAKWGQAKTWIRSHVPFADLFMDEGTGAAGGVTRQIAAAAAVGATAAAAPVAAVDQALQQGQQDVAAARIEQHAPPARTPFASDLLGGGVPGGATAGSGGIQVTVSAPVTVEVPPDADPERVGLAVAAALERELPRIADEAARRILDAKRGRRHEDDGGTL